MVLVIKLCKCGTQPETVKISSRTGMAYMYQVQCPYCGKCGPLKDVESEAVKAWNKGREN